MLRLPSSVRIFLAAEPTDMRKGFDGLAALVTGRGADVYSGHLFVFVSRRGDRVKVLDHHRRDDGFRFLESRHRRARNDPENHRDQTEHQVANATQVEGILCDALTLCGGNTLEQGLCRNVDDTNNRPGS